MKFVRSLLIVGSLSLTLACVSGCSTRKPTIQAKIVPPSAATVTNKVEQPIFPVMAWNYAPNDPAVLKKMKECGLTVAGFVAPGTLDACEAAGLKAIVSDARTSGYDWTKVDDTIARSNVTSIVKET